jgi:RNA recognition motif-containing protein
MEADASVIEGREVTVQYANTVYRAKSEEAPSKCLYIGNIPYELTDLDLQALFEDIQGVEDIRIPVDRRTGLPRGFAHIDFLDQWSATDGKEKLSRRAPYGRKLRVSYARRKIMNPEAHERHQMKKLEKKEKEMERENKRLAAAQPADEVVSKE